MQVAQTPLGKASVFLAVSVRGFLELSIQHSLAPVSLPDDGWLVVDFQTPDPNAPRPGPEAAMIQILSCDTVPERPGKKGDNNLLLFYSVLDGQWSHATMLRDLVGGVAPLRRLDWWIQRWPQSLLPAFRCHSLRQAPRLEASACLYP